MQRTILITGCSSGIGAALAREFAKRGHRVYATARRREALAPLEAEGIHGLALDVNDDASIAAAFAKPFRSRWIFDVEVLARYLAQPVPPGGQPRRARIYELAVPAWHDVPGSKLRWFDFVRSFFELARIRHDSRG